MFLKLRTIFWFDVKWRTMYKSGGAWLLAGADLAALTRPRECLEWNLLFFPRWHLKYVWIHAILENAIFRDVFSEQKVQHIKIVSRLFLCHISSRSTFLFNSSNTVWTLSLKRESCCVFPAFNAQHQSPDFLQAVRRWRVTVELRVFVPEIAFYFLYPKYG